VGKIRTAPIRLKTLYWARYAKDRSYQVEPNPYNSEVQEAYSKGIIQYFTARTLLNRNMIEKVAGDMRLKRLEKQRLHSLGL